MAITRPLPHQRECYTLLERFNGRALIANALGSGKSFQSLLYAYRHPELRPIIIVCPASLKIQWQRQCLEHFGMLAEVLETTRPPKEGLHNQNQILIVNYDILGQRRGDKTGEGWIKHLRAIQPKLIICDEIHAFANRRTARYRWIKQLCSGIQKILFLSGTPLTNRPAELWTSLNLLRPDLYPSFHDWAIDFCAPQLKPWGWDYSGATRLDVLHRNIKRHVCIRQEKKDILKSLPSKRSTIVPLPITKAKEYKKAAENFIHWLAAKDINKAKKASRAEKLVKVGYLLRLAAELKLPYVLEWLDSFLIESDEKIVLGAIHKPIIATLTERYQKTCVFVDGSVSMKDRSIAVDKFQKDPKIRVFVGNIKAAGVGLNLTAGSNVAMIEFPWTPGALQQFVARVHRIGSLKPVSEWYFVAENTIEKHLCQVLQKKAQTLDAVLDGKFNGDGDGLDIYDLLEAEIRKEQAGK